MLIKEVRSMKYTFEISIAGCNTDCLHCYIDGGPGAVMPYEDYILCIEKLKPVLDCLDGEISVTLGNELFNHSMAKDIVRETYKFMPEYFTYEEVGINTTGIALLKMPKDERDELMDALVDAGAKSACLTLHGNEEHHNEIVRNRKAFEAIKRTADYLNSYGIELFFSIMMNKYVIEDWKDIVKFLRKTPHYGAFAVVPLYLPIERLREYQQVRAEYDDYFTLRGKMEPIGIDEDDLFHAVEAYNEEAIADLVRDGFDYKEAEDKCPNWAFFNIDHNLNLYYGNAGASTKLIGNLKSSSTSELVEAIKNLKANYDYSAYYDIDELPPVSEILEKIKPLKTNYVYPDIASCLYSWFDLCSIPSRIITY